MKTASSRDQQTVSYIRTSSFLYPMHSNLVLLLVLYVFLDYIFPPRFPYFIGSFSFPPPSASTVMRFGFSKCALPIVISITSDRFYGIRFPFQRFSFLVLFTVRRSLVSAVSFNNFKHFPRDSHFPRQKFIFVGSVYCQVSSPRVTIVRN